LSDTQTFDLEALRALGDVDLRLSRARRKFERAADMAAPQRTRVEGIKREQAQLTTDLREAQKAVKTCELEMAKAEGERQKAEIALNQAKSNAEFQSLTALMDKKKGEISELETKVLEAYDVQETIEGKLAAGKERLSSQEKELAEAMDRVKVEEDKAQVLIDEAEAQRVEAAAKISKKHLELYERLLVQHQDTPLAELRDGMCGACGIKCRPEQISQARGAKLLVTCGSCQRILWLRVQ
jgi:uncharacterized protein